MNNIKYKDFPHQTYDKLRYRDTDRQGHVNNSVFSTFLETGRAEMLFDQTFSLFTNDESFVIANLNVNYVDEIKWPGEVLIGTVITKIGNSSIEMYQNLFQEERLVATATTIIVQVDNITKRSKPLSTDKKNFLKQFLLIIK